MRNILSLNPGWSFAKDIRQAPAAIAEDWEIVNLPHTWNATDGQDGGTSVASVEAQMVYVKEMLA